MATKGHPLKDSYERTAKKGQPPKNSHQRITNTVQTPINNCQRTATSEQHDRTVMASQPPRTATNGHTQKDSHLKDSLPKDSLPKDRHHRKATPGQPLQDS
jgi:hypothetical protein